MDHLCDTLHDATVINHPNCIKTLIEQRQLKGIPIGINDRDLFGCTPLHYASRFGYNDCIDVLLGYLEPRSSANIDEKSDRGYTALHYSSQYGKNDCIHTLIKRGANLNEKNYNGWTALHLVTYHNFTDCIATLLDNGANVNEKTDLELTIFDLGDEHTKTFVKEYFTHSIKEPSEE